jgi:hypothetical protein
LLVVGQIDQSVTALAQEPLDPVATDPLRQRRGARFGRTFLGSGSLNRMAWIDPGNQTVIAMNRSLLAAGVKISPDLCLGRGSK